MNAITINPLSGAALDTLWCLFAHGPTEDGDVPSKSGRDELVSRGLADRHCGWQWLTSDGAIASIDAGYGERKDNWARDRERRTRP